MHFERVQLPGPSSFLSGALQPSSYRLWLKPFYHLKFVENQIKHQTIQMLTEEIELDPGRACVHTTPPDRHSSWLGLLVLIWLWWKFANGIMNTRWSQRSLILSQMICFMYYCQVLIIMTVRANITKSYFCKDSLLQFSS